jgi:hypothetical protein
MRSRFTHVRASLSALCITDIDGLAKEIDQEFLVVAGEKTAKDYYRNAEADEYERRSNSDPPSLENSRKAEKVDRHSPMALRNCLPAHEGRTRILRKRSKMGATRCDSGAAFDFHRPSVDRTNA